MADIPLSVIVDQAQQRHLPGADLFTREMDPPTGRWVTVVRTALPMTMVSNRAGAAGWQLLPTCCSLRRRQLLRAASRRQQAGAVGGLCAPLLAKGRLGSPTPNPAHLRRTPRSKRTLR
jgi:hypothetical protein